MTLKEKYANFFKIGAAVNPRTIVTRADILKTHFNSLTCENQTKPVCVTQDAMTYNFTEGDQVHAFARENGMDFRLHTLAWHQATPPALYDGKNRDEAIAAMDRHFSRMAAKYGDACAVDVVNEAVSDDDGEFLRKTPLLGIIGEDYLDIAYTLARKHFPNTTLVCNDYYEWKQGKSQRIVKLIRGMLERGVPVGAVGLQCHYILDDPGFDEVRRAIELYLTLGLRLQMTEMDVSLFGGREMHGQTEPTRSQLERQADYYGKMFRIYREYAAHIDSVTFWGICDTESWLNNFPVKNRPDWPLPFDGDGNGKICLERIMDF